MVKTKIFTPSTSDGCQLFIPTPPNYVHLEPQNGTLLGIKIFAGIVNARVLK